MYTDTTAVYRTQCITWIIAQRIARNTSNLSSVGCIQKPPFCLRIIKQYQSKETQEFRDNVASVVWGNRVLNRNLLNK